MGKRYKVLLVDDSADDRFFMRLAIERSQNFSVVAEASDGEEAIEFLRNPANWPDVVLLDLKMPRKNGFEVLEWIRSQNLPNLKVAILSGAWLQEDIDRGRGLGALAYFKKAALKDEQAKMLSTIEELLS
jgi:CheY-like chemotaxis protein